METSGPISITESYQGREILLTGSTGFIGKVLLAMLLDQLPQIGKIHLLIRPHKSRSGLQRFEEMVNRHYVFAHLHEKYGHDLVNLLKRKVCVWEGSAEQPYFGLDETQRQRLMQSVRLVIHCAGLVDFVPDLRDSLSANVTATLHAAQWCRESTDCRLLHVSTCFVSGKRDGRLEECVETAQTPNGQAFNPEMEWAWVQQEVSKITQDLPSGLPALEAKRLLREQFKRFGMSHAESLGWSNTYTYTKALAEALLSLRYPDISWSIFRPAVVESALAYPFPGWNEGFNTSGPLAYLAGTWLKVVPAAKDHPFDLVPVDQVCAAMLLVGAALLQGKAHPVYQCGTSDLNPVSMGGCAELTSLFYQRYYKRHGTTWVQRTIRSRWKTVTTHRPHHPLGVSTLMALHDKLERVLSKSPIRIGLETLARNKKKLHYIQQTLSLFKPFILDHHQVFVTRNLTRHTVIEPFFRFSPQAISWPRYFLDVHLPGLRRWCFPIMERKAIAQYQPRFPVTLDPSYDTLPLQPLQRNA